MASLDQDQGGGWDPHKEALKIVAQLKSAQGGAITDADMKAMEVTADELRQRAEMGAVVRWIDDHGKLHYPRWQFLPNGTLIPGVAKVLEMLASSVEDPGNPDTWRVMGYFLNPRKGFNGETALALIQSGRTKEVLEHLEFHLWRRSW